MTDRIISGCVPHERPRERMLLYGSAALDDAELVALLLGGGHALRRAMGVLHRVGGLGSLARAMPHELGEIPGIGLASATALCAAFELGRRTARSRLPYAEAMGGPQDVVDFLRARIGDAMQEIFMVLGLDARRRVRLVQTVAVGSLAGVEVHPREVFRPLIRAGMHSAILVHNHPSGDAQPSDADVQLTHRLAEVGAVVGIPVVDHLVVTRVESVSLAALGLVPMG